MEIMLKSFYEVMNKYQLYFSEAGVRANLAMWKENKGNLINLLRNHPHWNEEAMAVILPLTESRDIDRNVVNERRMELIRIGEGTISDRAQSDAFRSCIFSATEDYSSLLSERTAETIKEQSDIKCAEGQKTSRAINRLCQKYGVNQHERYNAVFAQLSDALNPIETNRKAILSIHPCDYLEMSNKDNTWTSCHNLQDGSYQSGCLSYMNDGVTMIFYTVDNEVNEYFNKAMKRSRQVFCYANGVLLQSRLYPNTGDEDAIKRYRNIVQDIISTCLEVANSWILKKKKGEEESYSNYFDTESGSRQYRDYEYNCIITRLKELEIQDNIAYIGNRAYCVCCGDTLRGGSVKCGCSNLVVCHDCDQTVRANNARYVEGIWICNSCLHICAACHQPKRDSMLYPAYDRYGNVVQICDECYQNALLPCRECSIQSICSTLTCNRLCGRTAIAAA